MPERLNVVIVLAKCRSFRQSFGIRFEEKSTSHWVADWAFPIQDKKAHKEGYGQNEVRGSFGLDSVYPGCPHCHTLGFFKCSCGKVACWDGETRVVTCPWCDSTIELSGSIDRIDTKYDR